MIASSKGPGNQFNIQCIKYRSTRINGITLEKTILEILEFRIDKENTIVQPKSFKAYI